LISTIGEVLSGNWGGSTNLLQGGFLKSLETCWMPNLVPPVGYGLQQSVIASAGGIRSSAQYRSGDTVGQALSSDANFFHSNSYQLSSGFWGAIQSNIPQYQAMAVVKNPFIAPTPSMVPTATPVPSTFNIQINQGALYTNRRIVNVNLNAPAISEVRISASSIYANDGWTSYETALNFMLPGDLNSAGLKTIYVWFRDSQGIIYGVYQASVFYDPIAPQGRLDLPGGDEPPQALLLDAWDGESGVLAYRVGYSLDLTRSPWLPFSNVALIEPGHPYFFVQYKDGAGNLSPIYTNAPLLNIYLPITSR
jgi:hypothetical protein